MFKHLIPTSALLLALALALPAHATPVVYIYSATLRGANEVPANASLATGAGTYTLTGNTLDVFETFSGLSAPASGAHIHCCGPVGINEPVALPFTGFPSATFGTYSKTFDLTLISTYTSGFLTLEGGTASGAEAALIAGLNSGNAYANIHDTNFPGGEIRGQIAAPTPEPDGLLLLGTGMLGLLGAARRKVCA